MRKTSLALTAALTLGALACSPEQQPVQTPEPTPVEIVQAAPETDFRYDGVTLSTEPLTFMDTTYDANIFSRVMVSSFSHEDGRTAFLVDRAPPLVVDMSGILGAHRDAYASAMTAYKMREPLDVYIMDAPTLPRTFREATLDERTELYEATQVLMPEIRRDFNSHLLIPSPTLGEVDWGVRYGSFLERSLIPN